MTDDLLKENATLRAEIERLKGEREWRDIAEAPRDGTEVDVWLGNDEFPMRETGVSFREPTDSEFWSNGSDWPSDKEGTYGSEAAWFDCFGRKLNPTHFMPLPTPPAPKVEGEVNWPDSEESPACPECGERFAGGLELVKHKRAKHRNIKP